MDAVSTFSVSGTQTLADRLRFVYFHSFRRMWWSVGLALLFALPMFVLSVVAYVLSPDRFGLRDVTSIGLVLAFWLLIFVVLPYRSAKRQMLTSASASHPMTYVFTPAGIQYKGAHASGEVAYPAVWKVRETKSLFCVYLNAAAAVLIPKRFFESPSQESEWRAFLEQRIAPKQIEKPGFWGKRL